MSTVPDIRVRVVADRPIREDGDHVLYWMIANRRTRYNHALDHALDLCERLGKGLLVLEALRVDYPHASDRHHRFVLDGMHANAKGFEGHPVRYFPYVEPEKGAGRGLLAALAERAAVVVTDDWPCFFLPRMVEAAAKKIDGRLEAVDACGLHPLRLAEKAHPTAYLFRRHLQKVLPEVLEEGPRPQPFRARDLAAPPSVPRAVLDRWPEAGVALLEGREGALAELPLDHDVPEADVKGGQDEGRRRLRRFLEEILPRYAEDRNQPDEHATSELSPFLHYGHVSTWEVFDRLAKQEEWSLDDLSPKADGRRAGWWGMSESAEAFLDQVVTWRELGLNFGALRGGAEDYDTLPDWARASLAKHEDDPREHLYDAPTLERADTHDDVWNAAQRQLVREGRIHNYLRMLWGKKVLEWSPTPQEAWTRLLHLNDRWALDGRDPNSYSGIGWCFGRYDRPWAPERDVFGVIRFMSSASAKRKLRLREYLERYGEDGGQGDLFGGS